MKLTFYIFIFLVIFKALIAQQYSFVQQFHIPEIKPYTNPLTGGVGQPCISLKDVNNDNLPDLFVLNYDSKLQLYINKGNWNFENINTNLYDNLKPSSRFVFTDLANDGDDDFVTSNLYSQMLLYNNIGTQQNPKFSTIPDTIRSNDGNFIYIVGDMVPGFADIDNDFDNDLFLGNVDGSVTMYENIGRKKKYSFSFKTKNLGNIFVISVNNLKESDTNKLAKYSTTEKLHGGCALQFYDIDNDNDLDLFFGDLNMNTILMFENKGNQFLPQFQNSDHDTIFKKNGQIIITEGYNLIVFADIDNDGDVDCIVSQFRSSFLNKKLLVYENIGSKSKPIFEYKKIDLTNDFDLGSYSSPALISDVNGERILIGNGEGHVNKLLINKSNTFELIQDKIYDAPGAIMYLVSPAQNYIPFNKSELILGTQEGELRLVNITSNNKILRKQWPLDSINFGSPISPTFCNCGENYEYGILAGLGNGRFVFLKKDTSKLDNFIVSKAAHPFDTLDIGYDATVCATYNGVDFNNDGVNDLAIGGKFNESNKIKFYLSSENGFREDSILKPLNTQPNPKPMFYNFKNEKNQIELYLLVGNLHGGILSYKFSKNYSSVFNSKLEFNTIKTMFVKKGEIINFKENFKDINYIFYNILGQPFSPKINSELYVSRIFTNEFNIGVYYLRNDKNNDICKVVIY